MNCIAGKFLRGKCFADSIKTNFCGIFFCRYRRDVYVVSSVDFLAR